ncbi:MAG: hypothetical protein BIFFINMI_00935 [Phycisphaerae bacterium]|nr:hypothetical protein [Phycisphaerae bacterium]
MADDGSKVTDSDIALKMAMGDQEGLRLLLERYGWRIRAFLVKYYSGSLQEGELNEAFNVAIYNVWRFADRYEESKGSLPSWCIRIAQRAAQSIIRREAGYRSKNLEYDAMYDPAGDPPEDETVEAAEGADDPRIDALCKAVEALPTLQKAIIKADLAAGGLADAGRLAEIHGTSKNAVYVSRSKAREALKRQVEQSSRQPADRKR